MINLDTLRIEMFNEINSHYTYSGDKPDSNNLYANNCLDESIDWVKNNFANFSVKTCLPLKSDSKQVKIEKRKNRKEIERKAKEDVYNNTPRPKPSGFIATVTFGVLAMWVLQATVGWVISRLFNKIFIEESPSTEIIEENTRIV